MLTVRRKPNGVPAFVNVFEDFFNHNFQTSNEETGKFVPAVNVSENDKEFKLEFAAPGFEKQHFEVQIEKEYLTISANKEIAKETTEKKYTRKEFSYTNFKRTFTLPENVALDKIEAVYENGILHVALPKKEINIDATAKKIEIK